MVGFFVERFRVRLETRSFDSGCFVGADESFGGEGWGEEMIDMNGFWGEEEVGDPLGTADVDEWLEQTGNVWTWGLARWDERGELHDLRNGGKSSLDVGHGGGVEGVGAGGLDKDDDRVMVGKRCRSPKERRCDSTSCTLGTCIQRDLFMKHGPGTVETFGEG